MIKRDREREREGGGREFVCGKRGEGCRLDEY